MTAPPTLGDNPPPARTAPRCPIDRPPAHILVRLAAVPIAFGMACLVAPLPTLMAKEALAGVDEGLTGMTGWHLRDLALLPLLSIFTALFSGPVALPILFVLACRNARGVGLQTLLGTIAAIPAMILFVVLMAPLPPAIALTILTGGAVGGFVASSARDGVEHTVMRIRYDRATGLIRLLDRESTFPDRESTFPDRESVLRAR